MGYCGILAVCLLTIEALILNDRVERIAIDLKDLPALNVVGEFASDYPATLQFTQRVLSRPMAEAPRPQIVARSDISTQGGGKYGAVLRYELQ